MPVRIQIPSPLRNLTGDKATVDAEGKTVGEALTHVATTYPDLAERIFDPEGGLRRFINFFLNGDDIRHGKGRDTPVSDGDEIAIVPAIAGGSG